MTPNPGTLFLTAIAASIVSVMRILITGATGNVGQGITQRLESRHKLVLHDLGPFETKHPYFQGDVQVGDRLVKAAEGCDLIVHLPAWHGIHMAAKSEVDFWRLNVNGTFWMFQAAVQQGVKKVVYLSSCAWYNHYEKYGFTKVIGEELCEYYWRNHQIRYIALRPGGFTPWGKDFIRYGQRFFTIGVDRRDVLEAIELAVENTSITNDSFPIMPDNPFSKADLRDWTRDALAVLERHVPGSAALVRKYNLDVTDPPRVHDIARTRELLGWQPKHHLLTFLEELKQLDASGGIGQVECDYPVFVF